MRSIGKAWHTFAVVSLALMAGTACRSEKRELSRSGYVGFELPTPQPKPAFVLTTTDGRPFDFQRETDGYLTFLFFGYTHCPDVCPVHFSALASALHRMPVAITRGVRVVFVTTDPMRDTPAVLRRWLDKFDPEFIGLTGTEEALSRAQIASGVMPAARDSGGTANANYTVGHAAQVLVYTPDNLGRVQYPFGTRQEDWMHDIPRLHEVGKHDS